MSKYTRKKTKITEKDEFVSFWEHAFNAVLPYAKAIAITSGVAVVIVAVAWGGVAYSQSKAGAATEALGKALKTYDAEVTTGDIDTTPAAGAKVDPLAPPKFKTDKDRLDAALAEADKVKKEHGGAAGDQAELVRAAVLFEQGKLDDAVAIYQKQVDSQTGVAQSLVRESLGLALEQAGKLDLALTQFQFLEPKQGDFFRDRAMFDQARIYVKKGDKKKAIELYKDIVTKMPTTTLKDDVQQQLALLGEAMPVIKSESPIAAPKIELK